MENRAYIMTVAMQRWLAIRLELFANILVLGIALFRVGSRHTVSPSKFSVVLSYTLLGKSVPYSSLISTKHCYSHSDVLYVSGRWIYILLADLSLIFQPN